MRSSAPVRPAGMRRDDPAARTATADPRGHRTAGRVKQAATVVFAFAASVSFLLVNIVDPYSGATASSSYRPADRFADRLTRYFRDGWPIAIDDVRGVVFTAQRGGYRESQVDLVLDAVVDVMLAVR